MPSDLRVCFVGDSFVAGVGDPEHLGWVGRLSGRTHREQQPLTSYNLGVRLQTSRDIRDRWHRECALRLPAGCDARVVFSFGVNDTTWENGGPRVDPADSAAHLAALLRQADESGWRALAVGPPPVADERQNGRTALLDGRFADVCRDAGVGYLSVFDPLLASEVWMAQVRDGDGAHPAGEGYAEYARLVQPHWHGWLGRG
ncbi:GDSL-type esterase/lipase family protein [Streptomyces sp. NPDC092296]|uniref:GDSL-type esterase/lipase family protein n=1 Tax=Streptomyces sp. NPDC092296 TaxID=3366012 RepID=UPI00381496BF